MLSSLAFASFVSASNSNVSLSTEVVTAYTTYCPQPTSFVEGNNTYIVTEPTTLTVTDCPCTRTHTYSTATVTVCPSSASAPSVVGATNGNASSVSPITPNNANVHGVSIAAAAAAAVVVAQLI